MKFLEVQVCTFDVDDLTMFISSAIFSLFSSDFHCSIVFQVHASDSKIQAT